VIGLAIFENNFMNIWQYLAIPMNDLNFVTFIGVGHPLTAYIFLGSTAMPSAEII
jgi:hypothetical protein